MKHLILITLFAVSLALQGCATGTNTGLAQVAVQYATARTIEQSDTITAEGVLRYTELARTALSQDVQLDPTKIAAEILRALDAEDMSPADRVLASALVMQIQAQFEELDLLDPNTRLSLLTVLGWIDQAARMSQP